MTTINTTADALAAAAQYRATMTEDERLAAREAAGSASDVMANGFTVQDTSGPVVLTFASSGLYVLFLVKFVTCFGPRETGEEEANG